MPTGKCIYDTSSKKLLCTDIDNHRKQQLSTMQISADCVEPSINGYTYITAPALKAQRTLKERGWNIFKSQNARKSAVPENLSPKNDQLE